MSRLTPEGLPAVLTLEFEKLPCKGEASAQSVFHLTIKDSKKNRWTDCWLSVRNENRRVKFYLTHERGYPSQQKGESIREILGNWLSEELPI